ncbi:MAG: hypothetical protein JW821_04570 [Deltaproteobacteria bacterium]|nr:hypothetical protein [Deltaproteobacteria bacterium]
MKEPGCICLLIVLVFLLSSPSAAWETDKELTIPLPSPVEIRESERCVCDTLVGTSMRASENSKKFVTATVMQGTERVAFEVAEDALHFRSGADAETKEREPARFRIIHNRDQRLVAVLYTLTERGFIIDVFNLDKRTGIALWTRTNSSDPSGIGYPSVKSTYLFCR